MSEEEKQAIEEIKIIINYIEDNYTCNCDREDKEYFEMVLNLIDKLQKQLEQLKEVDRQICCEELITKDKYQDILKENEELKDSREVLSKEILSDKATIVLFKEKIEKLQKENEELKEQRDNAIKLRNELIEEQKITCISKNEIKAKINQIDEEYSKTLKKELSLEFHNINAQRHEAMKIVLEELLGE